MLMRKKNSNSVASPFEWARQLYDSVISFLLYKSQSQFRSVRMFPEPNQITEVMGWKELIWIVLKTVFAQFV